MDETTLIRPFLDLKEDVEIIWPGHFFRSDQNEWMVLTAVQRFSASRPEALRLPIGYMPLLRPGRCFSKGQMVRSVRRGVQGEFRVADLSDCDICTTEDIDPALLSRLAPIPRGRRRPAGVLHYVSGKLDVFIPAVELIRALFLPNATLANAIMRPQSLLALCVATEFGGNAIDLDFSRYLPVQLVRGGAGTAFVQHFAWIMTNPEARRSWESVGKVSSAGNILNFEPPRIPDTRFAVRWLRQGNAALVLEIMAILCPPMPVKDIRFTHPDIKAGRSRSVAPETPGDAESEDGEPQPPSPIKHYILEASGTAGGRSRQTKINAPMSVPLGFANARVTTLRLPGDEADATQAAGEGQGCARPPAGLDRPVITQRIQASVAEQSSGAALAPLEFKLLPPYSWNDPGELAPLTAIIDWMASTLPQVRVGRHFTVVPESEKRISWVGHRARPVLIAVFQPEREPPRVLIDVDHSEGVSLSMLAIFYATDTPLLHIEEDVALVLQGLIQQNGHWDRTVLDGRGDALTCVWMPRVLRKKGALSDDDYVTKWGLELLNRMGLGHFW